MIFLLEDDDSIRKLISYTLKTQNYECKDFSHPDDFWNEIHSILNFNSAEKIKLPQLILLDIMLPKEDGISILTKIRKNPQISKIPVIMLTAKDSEFDVVNGLDSGADDYITKPFGMMTLLSRIKAVLRRYEQQKNQKNQENLENQQNFQDEILFANEIKVNLTKHTVFVGENQIVLTVKEFDLLVLLIKNRKNVLSREKILEVIWQIDSYIDSRTIDVHIKTLRQKLGNAGNIIETVRGIGYKCS